MARQHSGTSNEFCEYCHLPQAASPMPFVTDHIIAKQHGGGDEIANLALSCPKCNLYKGPNIAGLDPMTGALSPLFNPRRDRWSEHFQWNSERIIGLSLVGRTTTSLLRMNDESRLALRKTLLAEGWEFAS